MGKCLSKRSAGKPSKEKKSHTDSSPVVPDNTTAENTQDLFSYQSASATASTSNSKASLGKGKALKHAFYNNSVSFRITSGPSRTLEKFDRVVWVDDDGQVEIGTFKWIGKLDGEVCVGLELDNKRTVVFGDYNGKKMFNSRPGHRAIVPLYQVMLLEDYQGRQHNSTLESDQTSVSTIPKRKMEETVDKYYTNQKDCQKRLKAVNVEVLPLSSSEAETETSNVSINSENSGTTLIRNTNFVTPRTVPSLQIDPSWSPGDRIKFRNSEEEAEILEMKLENSGYLVTKIKYTEESSRPGEIVVTSLIDVMSASSLVVPPILHDSFRNNSFLQAVSPTYRNENDDSAYSLRNNSFLQAVSPIYYNNENDLNML